MITNERQYNITRKQLQRFLIAIDNFDDEPREGVHPAIMKAELASLKSQMYDLRDEVHAYEELKSSSVPVLRSNTFDQFAERLIEARIAAGLTQKDLAERLGIREQQIQRYEAQLYASASLQRLQDVADAIGLRVESDLMIPIEPRTFEDLTRKVSQVGITRDFLVSRLVPTKSLGPFDEADVVANDNYLAERASEALERVYGWTRQELFAPAPLPPAEAGMMARFKMPVGRRQEAVNAYTAYAHYLATIVVSAMNGTPIVRVPDEPDVVRNAILKRYRTIDLRSAVNFAWDLGVAVLPLKDSGAFHGACWRHKGRNVVVLKQRSNSEERWLFDLFHELYHASQHPDLDELAVVEAPETSNERREADEEIEASQFAGEVILAGSAEELVHLATRRARGSVERLKAVIPKVAEDNGVTTGALANDMAFRLSLQGIDWWGTATNLQPAGDDPYEIVRSVFYDRFPFDVADRFDAELLRRSLENA